MQVKHYLIDKFQESVDTSHSQLSPHDGIITPHITVSLQGRNLAFTHFWIHCAAELVYGALRWIEVVTNLLVLPIVPGHSAMGSLSLNSLAIWAHEN